MMERGCFCQAAETLQDAVNLIKAASSGHAQDLEMQAMNQKAVHKTLQPEKTVMSNNTRKDLRIHLVSDDLDAACVERALGMIASTTSVCFPVCIESHNQSLYEEDPALICCIILHNFGITCVARTQTCTKASVRSRLLHKGFKLFQLYQVVLASRSATCRDQAQLKRLVFLGVAVVSGIVFCLDGTAVESKEYHDKLTKLMASVVELERSDFLKPKYKGAAAA
jgi:hypothetical protein